ncbi:hypothetical protein ACFSC4_11035 [Deinococcus malanensis]|uniref:hypothetical protein n=1 Tax=Deinococcus malanensis TaxID=1706855 RepID=UPI00362C5B9E
MSGAVLGGAGAAQAYRFGVIREQQGLRGLATPLRAAFLTDLHYGPLIGTGSVRAWVQAANALRPDLVLLGGDYLDVGPGETPHPAAGTGPAARAAGGVRRVGKSRLRKLWTLLGRSGVDEPAR